jgi:two-component system, OmpR family, response regulator
MEARGCNREFISLDTPDRGGTSESGEHDKQSIYLISDDIPLRTDMESYLQGRGMRFVVTMDAQTATHQLVKQSPRLIILDVAPHQEDELDVLRTIRELCDAPVIVTVGPGCNGACRAKILDLGADDCIAKPIGMRELAARIGAILRGWQAACARSTPRLSYRFGGWNLDCRERRLTSPTGVIISLRKSEYTLLVALLDSPQRPLTRQELMQATSKHEDCFDRSIDVRVLRLRRKLETGLGAQRIILTERGVGYRFELPVECA